MNHYLYKIVSRETGKWYVGIRQSKCWPAADDYWGSGRYIKAAIKKHGQEAFTRKVLVIVQNREESNRLEELIVTPEAVANEMCYNLRAGGMNGTLGEEARKKMSATWKRPEVKAKHRAAMKEAQNRPEVKAKMSAAIKEAWKRPGARTRNSVAIKEAHSRPEVKAKRCAVMKEVCNRPEEKARRCAVMKKMWKWPEERAKRSAAAQRNSPLTWEIVCAIRERHATGMFMQIELAILAGAGSTTIGGIVHYKTWREEV